MSLRARVADATIGRVWPKRRRAERLGWSFRDAIADRRVYYWCDPVTGECWMAQGRYDRFTIDSISGDDRERIVSRLRSLPMATCEVEE